MQGLKSDLDLTNQDLNHKIVQSSLQAKKNRGAQDIWRHTLYCNMT